MPSPDLVAQISFAGQTYNNWEWVEFERRIGAVASHLRVRVVETNKPVTTGWASGMKLKPGDRPVVVTLAGRQVMNDGFVSVRQAQLSADSHLIEIVAASRAAITPYVTPDLSGGQFKNSSMTQIASAILAPYGIGFSLLGSPSGADKPFERFSIHPGETALQAIERMARMRDVHLVDDSNGNLTGGRGYGSASGLQLIEGQNIERGQIVMSVDEMVANLTGVGQNYGTDQHWGDQARDISATATNANAYVPGTIKFFAEMPGDSQDMAMRTNHEASVIESKVIEAFITVPGWLLPDGSSLWCDHIWQTVTIKAPSLFPVDSIDLSIRGVKHHQSNEYGTISTIECCLPRALGSTGALSGPDAYPSGFGPSTPQSPTE